MEIVKENEHEGLTEEEIKEVEEQDAVGRQVYDPINRKYDARRRRATDLPSCPRITLPRPLDADEEAKIELRRNSQQEVFKKYMEENKKPIDLKSWRHFEDAWRKFLQQRGMETEQQCQMGLENQNLEAILVLWRE